MPKKKPRDRDKETPRADPAATAAAWKRRRNRRLIVLGLIALSFPIVEVVAYRYRAITVTVANRTSRPMIGLKVTYTGGSFGVDAIEAGGSVTRVIVPDYTFRGSEFSTYRTTIEFSTPGGFCRQTGRAGTLDYSAHETYTLQLAPPEGPVELKHTTFPGFPLGTIRELLQRLGIG